MKRSLAMLVLVLAMSADAAPPEINSIQDNGLVTWTSTDSNATYTVQWSYDLSGDWRSTWQTLDVVDPHTNGLLTARVPMFYRLVMLTNAIPYAMPLVDGGPYVMGDNYGESPLAIPHTVYVSPFYIERFEVTKAVWDKAYTYGVLNGFSFSATGTSAGLNFPVHDITWYDIIKWCNARSMMEGLTPAYYTTTNQTTVYMTGTNEITSECVKWEANGYRLPTEAEWEKAARGGLLGHHFPWNSYGGSWSSHLTENKANYTQSFDPYEAGASPFLTPVSYYNGSQQVTNSVFQTYTARDMANPLGLYDMAGNVWERCWDWLDANYYATSPTTDPKGPSTGTTRVMRGGSAGSASMSCRVASRGSLAPFANNSDVGFRCVRSR